MKYIETENIELKRFLNDTFEKVFSGLKLILENKIEQAMNLYNLKSSDMTITLSDQLRNQINIIYREKILKHKVLVNQIMKEYRRLMVYS